MKKFRKILSFLFIFFVVCSVHAQHTLRERLEQHVFTLASDSLQGRKAGTEFAQKAAEYIVYHLKEIGIEPYGDSCFLQKFNDGVFRNVVGIIRGNDAALNNQYIVIGAHYDHIGVIGGNIHNGADDNASGVAVLIELARKLKYNQANLGRNVILIAFDAEEIGLVGSTYFVNHPHFSIKNIKLMMSVDMVGWYQASGKIEFQGSRTIRNGREIVENPQLIPEGLNVVARNFERHLFAGTDTWPFAQKGIPTFAVTTGLLSPYHKPEDEAHLIDLDGMVLITEHLNNLVVAISNDPNFRPSGRIAKKHRTNPRFEFGISGNIGTNRFHYTAGAVTGKSIATYGAGFVTQVNFGASRTWAIRPEVHYDHARARHPNGTITTNNITVPLNLVLQTSGQLGQRADLFIGGYYSHRFDGKQGRVKLDFENGFNRQEYGFTYGFGLRVGPFKGGFTGRVGLTNFTTSPYDNNVHLRNRANYFTLTYFF